MSTRWLVTYSTERFQNLKIVIWCETKTEARAMLKKHMGNTPYTINKIERNDTNA